MATKKSMSAREKQWQAEDDARTMAIYQEIISDKSRLTRATKEAEKQAKFLEKRASVLNKVAKKRGSK